MLPFLAPILEIVNKFIPSKDAQIELQKELSSNSVKIEETFKEYAKIDAEIRLKEMSQTGWKSAVRPALMAGFGSIIFIYCFLYYIMPGIVIYFNINVWIPNPPEVDSNVWDVILYCILGIAGMRTADKAFKK